jgi:hypothetical protein
MIYALLIIIVILIVFLFLRKTKPTSSVSPATNLTLKYIRRKNNMEIYTATWVPSTSTFVEKQQVFVGLNGATPTQVLTDLPSSTETIDLSLETGAVVEVFIRTIGDNETQADTPIVSFTATNEEKVVAATNLSVAWKSHSA